MAADGGVLIVKDALGEPERALPCFVADECRSCTAGGWVHAMADVLQSTSFVAQATHM